MPRHLRHPDGYTLAELMITVGVFALIGMLSLGLIRNIAGQGTASDYKRRVQQAAVLIQSAYTRYREDHNPSATTTIADLTPYIDYLSIDSTSTLDENANDGTGTLSCASYACLKLKNGATLIYFPSFDAFGGTTYKYALLTQIDPDGLAGSVGQSDGLSKAVALRLYYDGKILTQGAQINGTCNASGCPATYDANQEADPYWFNWN